MSNSKDNNSNFHNSSFNIYDININKNNTITNENVVINTNNLPMSLSVCKVFITCPDATNFIKALHNYISRQALYQKEINKYLLIVKQSLKKYNEYNDMQSKFLYNFDKKKRYENNLKEFYNKSNKNIDKIIKYHSAIFRLEQKIRLNDDIVLSNKNIFVYFYKDVKGINTRFYKGIIKKINIKKKIFIVQFYYSVSFINKFNSCILY